MKFCPNGQKIKLGETNVLPIGHEIDSYVYFSELCILQLY